MAPAWLAEKAGEYADLLTEKTTEYISLVEDASLGVAEVSITVAELRKYVQESGGTKALLRAIVRRVKCPWCFQIVGIWDDAHFRFHRVITEVETDEDFILIDYVNPPSRTECHVCKAIVLESDWKNHLKVHKTQNNARLKRLRVGDKVKIKNIHSAGKVKVKNVSRVRE